MFLRCLAGDQTGQCLKTILESHVVSGLRGGIRRRTRQRGSGGKPSNLIVRRDRTSCHAIIMRFVIFRPARTSRMASSPRHNFANNAIPTDIGKRIAGLRGPRGWSMADLSARSGVPRETISRLESGLRTPLADTVLRLLVILLAGQDEVELMDIVPDWPEADGRQIIGHGPRSRVRRRQAELSAAAVAATAGVSEATLSRFERNACATPSLLVRKITSHGDELQRLCNVRLATTLRFGSLADHEAFCDADDWMTWPVR